RALCNQLGLNDCVTFFGEQSNVSTFLVSADLFVMSSVSEGLPISLLEAMSAGLPAIVTDVGGMGEVARLSGVVTLVPPSNPQAMAKALCEIVGKIHELPDLGKRTCRFYQENFKPERMLSDYMRLYDGCKSLP